MAKFLTRYEPLVAVILMFFFVGVNVIPMVLHAQSSPPDRFYTLVHDNENDYYLYLSLIREGVDGQWLATNPYDVTPSQPSLISAFFVIIGRIGGMMRLPVPVIYHLARILFAFTSLLLAYRFISVLLAPSGRLLTFFFFLIGGSLLRFETYQGSRVVHQYMEWWRGADVLRRVALYPHHLFAETMMLTTLLLLLRFAQTRKLSLILVAIFSTNLAGLVHAPSNFIVTLALVATVAVLLWRIVLWGIGGKSPKNFRGNFQGKGENRMVLVGYSVFVVFSIISLLLIRHEAVRGFPWNQLGTEVFWQFPFDRELLGGLGVLFPFAVIGIIRIIGKIRDIGEKDWWQVFVVCWFVVPIFLMPLSQWLGISNIRLFQGMPYLPLGILAGVGYMWLYKRLPMSGGPLLLIILIFSLPTIWVSAKGLLQEFRLPYSNIYIRKEILSVGAWFTNQKLNEHRRPVVLSSFYTGNYLPAFAPIQVYGGHHTYTPEREKRAEIAKRFFAGEMKEQEVKQLLKEAHIDFVLAGEDDGWEEKNRYPNFLQPVFQSGPYSVLILRQ